MSRAAFPLLLAAALGAAAPARAEGAPDRKTLAREPDAVVVRGRKLSWFLGRPIANLGLVALANGRWAPIPRQIDERAEDGGFVYTHGLLGPRPPGAGTLKPQDELVFMARDAGDRWAGPGAPAPPEGAGEGLEIALAEPERGAAKAAEPGRAWAYLFTFASDAPESPADYVAYDRSQGRVTGRSYAIGFSPAEDKIYMESITVPPSAGGNGRNFVDRLKIRMHLRTHLWFKIVFDEDDWESAVPRWIDGPVRVVRAVENELTFLGVDVAPKVTIESTFYAEHHVAPAVIEQTVHLPSIAREAYLETAMDLSEAARGMRYWRPSASGDGDPLHAVDGVTTQDEKDLDPRRPRWHLVSGAPGAMIWRLEPPEPLVPVTSRLYFDDAARPDPPERVPGLIGEMMYRFDLFPLDKGTYRVRTYYIFPPNYRPGMERDWQQMIDRPLEVTVAPVADR